MIRYLPLRAFPVLIITLIVIIMIILSVRTSFSVDWHEFESKEGSFSALFPDEPSRNMRSTPSEIGNIDIILFMYRDTEAKSGNMAYVAGYYNLPGNTITSNSPQKDLNLFFDNSRDGAMKNVNGNLITEEEIVYNNIYPGRLLEISFGDSDAIYYKMILVKNRMYFMQVVTKKNNSEKNHALKKFLDSIKINY